MGGMPTAPRLPLRRPRECLVSGVSAGLAAHLGARVWVVRALFIGLTLLWGAGIMLYAWFWAFMPWSEPDDGAPTAAPSRRAPVAWILVGLAAIALIVSMAASAGVVVTIVLAVAAGVWAALVDRKDPARGPRHALAVRASATLVLGILFLVQVGTLQRYGGIAPFVHALLALVGIGLVYGSTLIDRWRELSGERIRRIREEQRSEMAAHLHDSVLQTLALIQNRAGASSEVARLARAQERELRAWLYDGDAPADSDLPTDLRDYASGLELDYPVRIDVVSAGSSTERASGDVAAAAREAMLNAARHAGGEVSVYIEGTASTVDVYVRDRGQGFALADVPGDRLGVRESIIGRMRRAGGSASVRPGVGGAGTEVHLHFETATAPRPVEQAARRG
jgi:signal transduction histidine kinase